MDTAETPEQECTDCQSEHRNRVLKNMSPEGLAICLENELEETVDSIDFLTKKSEAIRASIAKLRQPQGGNYGKEWWKKFRWGNSLHEQR